MPCLKMHLSPDLHRWCVTACVRTALLVVGAWQSCPPALIALALTAARVHPCWLATRLHQPIGHHQPQLLLSPEPGHVQGHRPRRRHGAGICIRVASRHAPEVTGGRGPSRPREVDLLGRRAAANPRGIQADRPPVEHTIYTPPVLRASVSAKRKRQAAATASTPPSSLVGSLFTIYLELGSAGGRCGGPGGAIGQ